MFEIEKTFDDPGITAYPSLGDPGKVLFFDIETTGLSPYGSALYLVGAQYFKDGKWHFRQWFSESLSDEIPVLQAFSAFLGNFGTLVHYNGDTFDIPYLTALYEQYHLDVPFGVMNSVDILKSARRVRALLQPDSLRQKHIEKELGIRRDDVYTGAELIEVYRQWQTGKPDSLLRDLLLHNEEDVRCLPKILPLLSFDEVLIGRTLPESLHAEKDPENERLVLSAEYPFSFPLNRSVDVSEQGCRVFFRENTATLSVPFVHTELKKYLPNPKQYFYLLREDMIIPRELGSGVDPKNRVPARKDTCYVRLTDDFVPAISGIPGEVFRKDLLDKSRWLRLKDLDLNAYFQSFLQSILTLKAGNGIEKTNR